MDCSMPGLPVHHQLLKFTQTHVHWVSDAIQPSHPLLSLILLPSIFPSIRVFSNESALCMRWPKYWSFSFNISPSNEHPGLISFRMDWLDLLAVRGTLKSLLQHYSSKASILQHSAFFIVQLSHPYMTTGKTITLTRRTFVGKVMSLLFNMLPRLVITFLSRSKRLLISWLQSPCPLNRWCHPAISSSVVPFSSFPQSFPESGSFQMSQLFAWGGQSIGISASTSVLPMNIQDWSPLGWTGWISLQSKGPSRVFSNITVQKHQFFCTQLSL